MAGALELKIELWGRVQGVNLRRNVSKYAQVLGLTGYVKNRADGSVIIIAHGEKSSLEELLLWSQKAVFPARVTGMSYEWGVPEKEHKQFKVIKDKPFVKDQASSFLNLGKEVFGVDESSKVPNHVVIIADGNRRWARARGWKPWVGHEKASKYERLKAIFGECKKSGVKYLSMWVWSTENWERDKEECDAIFDIFRGGVEKASNDFVEDGICFRHIGRKDRLPKDIIEGLAKLEEKTKDCTKFYFQLCMDYGGRDEIVRAMNGMIKDGVKEVTEELISKYLDTQGIPDPDLVIRTSGEKRTSGMMPYQAAYAELYFTNVPFPDFDAEEFRRAVLEYGGRTRRFGGTAKTDTQKIDIDALYEPDENAEKAPEKGTKLHAK